MPDLNLRRWDDRPPLDFATFLNVQVIEELDASSDFHDDGHQLAPTNNGNVDLSVPDVGSIVIIRKSVHLSEKLFLILVTTISCGLSLESARM